MVINILSCLPITFISLFINLNIIKENPQQHFQLILITTIADE